MNIKEFNNIYDFNDAFTSALKEYEQEFKDFCERFKKTDLPYYFFIYEFYSDVTNSYLTTCTALCGTLEDCKTVFDERDKIICSINRDFKIENYCIKKA